MIKKYCTVKEFIKELLNLNQNDFYLFEAKEPKCKRSLKQNKMLWELIHKLAKATYHDDLDIYCAALERADAKSDYVITSAEMEEALRKSFRGVKFVRMQEVNSKSCYIYKVYLGSSKMDTKEMYELLEIVKSMCIEAGIDILGELYE